MTGAVWLTPSHERKYLKRLGYVRQHHHNEASSTDH
jgi:hypothetical protein